MTLSAAILAGCDSMPVNRGDDPDFLAASAPAPLPQQYNNGAIFQAAQSRGLFEDYKARQVGDLLNVILIEKTDASKTAKTSATKDSNVDIDVARLDFNGTPVSPLGSLVGINSDAKRSFDGQGDSEQSNSLEGNISVTVAEVLPNGNLVIQGEKWLGLNQGKEYVRLRGIVRPVDITAENTVLSTQVGDVQIYYGGTGAVADSNAMGWIMRFFISAIMPF
ncbi:flagellar basal body L-ring protein [Thiorhodovibrio frisius]|uniref:Flagellar L-ring protein n=1 Tax=Thiorhodovibrio frisius TaxID=631362 RepID=H8YZP8_9GAMM|nr:flagellar basal body L-ring protein [Thiorhodovibrio frisius]WPL24469.1 Basal body L-ring protein [Thiorhodovibrio frisius]